VEQKEIIKNKKIVLDFLKKYSIIAAQLNKIKLL
jgi:hypothetical protein